MAFRLVAEIEGRAVRFPLSQGRHAVGSSPACSVVLAHPSVSRRHATISVSGTTVEVEDLDSRNGVRVGDARVTVARLTPGDIVAFGRVVASLEAVPDDDLEAAVVLIGAPEPRPEPPVPGPEPVTVGSAPIAHFAIDSLPALLDLLATRQDPVAVAQAVGAALLAALPCLTVSITPADRPDAVVYSGERDVPHVDGFPAVACGGGFEVRVVFPTQRQAMAFEPLLGLGARLLTLAHRGEGRARRVVPMRTGAPELPQPVTVVPRLQTVYSDAVRVASGDVAVLILGESGTGKEVLARYIHAASAVVSGPFFGLNCAALPRDLLEAELFGIEKGVATGVDARPGKFELASTGTLFLDEISDMALETQAKILRVLQSGEVFRLGGREPREARVRIVAATNRDPKAMLSSGAFRTDLYHRIAGWVVELPPLRQRRADIANLAVHFLAQAAARRGVAVAGISRAALQALLAYSWPGNVRQLETEMARAVLFLEDGELLDTSRLSPEVARARDGGPGGRLQDVLDRVERDEIVLVLGGCGGDVEAAAERLGVSRATLYRRMKALRVEPR